MVTERVMVKEASTRIVPVATEYEIVTEQVMIQEASTCIYRVPSRYTTETETIEVSPATAKWFKRKADRNCFRLIQMIV